MEKAGVASPRAAVTVPAPDVALEVDMAPNPEAEAETTSLSGKVWRAWVKNCESLYLRSSASTHSATRSYVLDGLRALAVFWVIAFHVMVMVIAEGLHPLLSRLVSFWPAQVVFNGDMGVDVFFTLSGYLIGRILLRDLVLARREGPRGVASALLTFYVRRWLRIFPLLAAAIAITVACNEISLAVNGGQGFAYFAFASGAECSNFSEVWPILLFVNNYVGNFGCLVQTWSVAVEMQMYLVSPLVLWLAFSLKDDKPRRFCYAFLFALSLLQIGFNALHLYAPSLQNGQLFFFIPTTIPPPDKTAMLPLSYAATWCRFSPYVSGLAVGIAQREGRKPALGGVAHALWALLVLSSGGALLFLGVGNNYMTYEVSPALAQVLALAGRWWFGWCVAAVIRMCQAGRLRALRGLLSLECWYPVAVLSYGMYLLHLIWVTMVKGVDDFKAISPLQSVWVSWSVFSWDFTVCVVLSALSALLTYLALEKPVMNLRPSIALKSRDGRSE